MLRFLIVMSTLIALHANARHIKMNLQTALEKKLVSGTASAKGGYQGYCMALKLKNLLNDSVVIVVEAGRRLKSFDAYNQDILIVKEEIIALKRGETKSTEVKGYCCQATLFSPSKGARYELNAMADSNLVRVARYLNRSSFDSDTEQQAIWAISDNKTTGNIAGHQDSLVRGLRRMVAGLKGEEVPWYSVITRAYNFRSGAILSVPVALQGSLQYAMPEGAFVTLQVFDEKGLPVVLVKKHWLGGAAVGEYELDLPLKGLNSGKYTVSLSSDKSVISEKHFTI